MRYTSTKFTRVHGCEDIPLPKYETPQSAGMDLRAVVDLSKKASIVLQPGERKLIPTGIRLAIPRGYEAQIRPRSGLALKHGVTVLNSPGTIDADYRGEIGVILINLGAKPFTVERGDRIAQMVFCEVTHCSLLEVEGGLPATGRGEGGFGHTGDR